MAKPPPGFARFLVRAARLLKNPGLLKQLLAQAVGKLNRAEKWPDGGVKEQLRRMIAPESLRGRRLPSRFPLKRCVDRGCGCFVFCYCL